MDSLLEGKAQRCFSSSFSRLNVRKYTIVFLVFQVSQKTGGNNWGLTGQLISTCRAMNLTKGIKY